MLRPFATPALISIFHRDNRALCSFVKEWRALVVVTLIMAMLSPSIAVARPLARSSVMATQQAATGTAQDTNKGMPSPERPLPAKQTPKRPPSKAEREAKVASLEINPATD